MKNIKQLNRRIEVLSNLAKMAESICDDHEEPLRTIDVQLKAAKHELRHLTYGDKLLAAFNDSTLGVL